MSSNKLPLPGNSMSLDDVTDIISSSAVVRAMQKVNLDYEPTDKEKLDEVMTHPELLARAVAMIVTNKTDKEIGQALDLTPFSVGFIRENEFVKTLCEECFADSVGVIKRGLASITENAMSALANLVDPETHVSEKTRFHAADTIIKTVLKMQGQYEGDNKKAGTVNVTQINNNTANVSPDAQEAYQRAMRDMASIIPVAGTMFGGGEDEKGTTSEPTKSK